MKNSRKLAEYLCVFVLGMIFVFTFNPVYKFVDEMFFKGFEVQSQASFPIKHMARVYSAGGFGDQTITLEVDDKTVWALKIATGGDLGEKLIWDKTGEIVTLELLGKPFYVYDAESKIEVKDINTRP